MAMLFNFVSKPARRPTIGLILTGGGARAAYQAGVLAGIARLLPEGTPSPFRVICGTSAGALNASIIAQDAGHFALGVNRAVNAWATLHNSSVHRSDLASVARHVGRWAWTAVVGDKRGRPVSLLDNTPLRQLVPRLVDFSCVRAAIRSNHLDALSITASSYRTGQSVSFYEGNDHLQPWASARRRGVRATLGPEHVLGSMAIPFMYPPERIGDDHFGDGAIQQLSPISPAIHLGAEKVLIIGVGRCSSAGAILDTSEAYPSIAQISGHLFDSIFADTLESDLERIRQVNEMLSLIPAKVRERAGLPQREVDTWVMNPRQSLEELAAIRVHRLPTSLRLLLRAVGAMRDGRASVLSYVLTEEWYCRSLIRRGFRDAMAQRADIAEFLELPLNAQRATSRRRPEIARARTPVAQPVSAPAAAAVESPLMLPLQA
ncbi:MAG: patatin-like phospholipase family protein [Steroidobacteraceae bacterium]